MMKMSWLTTLKTETTLEQVKEQRRGTENIPKRRLVRTVLMKFLLTKLNIAMQMVYVTLAKTRSIHAFTIKNNYV